MEGFLCVIIPYEKNEGEANVPVRIRGIVVPITRTHAVMSTVVAIAEAQAHSQAKRRIPSTLFILSSSFGDYGEP